MNFSAKNKALCRKDLDFIQTGNFSPSVYEEVKNITFFKIRGIASFWASDERIGRTGLIASVLSGFVRHGISYVYAIIGDENGINVYIGVQRPQYDVIVSGLRGVYPGIDILPTETNPLRLCVKEYGGLFTGMPTDKTSKGQQREQIENICRGMLGTRFVYLILAVGFSGILATLAQDRLHEELEAVYPTISKTISGGVQGNLSVCQQDFFAQSYYENLELLEAEIKAGIVSGMWRVNGYYASDTIDNARKLACLVKSGFSGEESKPDALRTIEYQGISDIISNMYMMSDLTEHAELHPLGSWNVAGRNVEMFVHKFSTVLSSERLGIFCNLPTKEFQGYYVDRFVEFDIHDRLAEVRSEPVFIGEIKSAGTEALKTGGSYTIEKNDFTRHALIVGITGGGKTNTSKSILATLWTKEKIPFLVIESAKREYWELRNIKGFEELIIFTLGDESAKTAVPYRINPFEANPRVSLQTHIDYLLAAFKAAFDLYPPAPYILEQAVYEVYADRGWDTVENINRYGLTQYPTLSDLYDKVEIVVDRLGYHAEVKSNVEAALSARIYSLMIGGKGEMLNTPKSVPIDYLLSAPTVLELEDLGDDETKSFVIGVLLVQLYEHRKSQMTAGSKALSHILLVEEAHRLLKNVPETGEGSNTRARAVEFFCNMLAEIRTYGQGIIIADQIPTKLASDTIKNTNLKIVHRTVAQDDRETIGGAMNMSVEQIEYLSSLKRGYAAVYAEGDNRPKLVKMPLVEYWDAKKREEIVAESRAKSISLLPAVQLFRNHHTVCIYCEHSCDFCSYANSYIQSKVNCGKVLAKWNAADYAPKALQAFLKADLMSGLGKLALYQQICIIGVMLERNKALSCGKRKKIVANYLEYICQSKEEK